MRNSRENEEEIDKASLNPTKTRRKDASNAPSASRPYSVAKESVMLECGRLTRVFLTFYWRIPPGFQ
jgi:hypothetical protein